ncbi:chromosomal replication initiator protein DnaA [Candidatus Microgenomates bacterium]|nr:MAG: chromosomal replication initiator protein DnaA [Candidatus Microgenomates bacterium]
MDIAVVWKSVLSELEVAISKPVFQTFLASSMLKKFESGVATISCNNAVTLQMIETRYYTLIKSLLDKHTGENTSLLFTVSSEKTPSKNDDVGPLFAQPHPQIHRSTFNASPHLRSDYTFESFAVSTSNQMAYAAATAVAAAPGITYNPLFIYGGVGVGKTHLMQAIGNDVYAKNPSIKIIFCMGEEFTNEIIDAIQTKSTKRFKDKYRTAKILLIDDIQFIAGKNAVQEEFFHTFNALQREGGQIVMTSDRPPQEIDRLEERLRSRFEQGLLIDVQNPDFELRAAILRIKAQHKGIDLPTNIAQILAANVESVRRLEGLLTRLISEANLKKVPISEELASQIVGKGQGETAEDAKRRSEQKKLVTPQTVTDAVIKRFGITWTQLKGEKRARPIARPRQILMYLLRTELQLPLDEVGGFVGGRDHTTVMHAVETITHLLSTNELMRGDVSWIKKELYG